MNVDLPERERVIALFHLSEINGVDPVPMDEALIEAMVTLAQTAREVLTRRMTWFRLGNMAGPDVVDDLVEALAEEPSETVREWVVHALEMNIDEPGVRDALESAQLNDPSPLVRSTAERVLLGEEQ
jgi:HEAT repeat protein